MKNEGITPYPELDVVLYEYANRLKYILGSNFVGFYLQGSLALGDFDQTSDIDFIVVINKELTAKLVKSIQTLHLETYSQNNRWVKRFEYSFFPIEKLNIFSSPFVNYQQNDTEERLLWYFNNGHETIEKSDHCNTLVTRWTLREKGVTILGPDIRTLIKPINSKQLRTEIKNTMVGWAKIVHTIPVKIQNRFYQSYLVLNYARMLHNLYEGKVTSKKESVIWAKRNLDHRWNDLIDFCWKERQDSNISVKQLIVPEVFERVLEFVSYTTSLAEKFNTDTSK